MKLLFWLGGDSIELSRNGFKHDKRAPIFGVGGGVSIGEIGVIIVGAVMP